MNKKIFFISFLFLIIFSTFTYAADPAYTITDLVFGEDFDYSDFYSFHSGWNYAGDAGDDRFKKSVTSHFASNAWGFNETTGGSGLTSVIDKDITTPKTDPIIVFNYTLTKTNDHFRFYLSNETIGVAGNANAAFLIVEVGINYGTKNIVFGENSQNINTGLCNITFPDVLPQTHEIVMQVDQSNNKYSVVIDNQLITNCTDLVFIPNSEFLAKHLNFRFASQAATSYNFSVDNIKYGGGEVAELGTAIDIFNCATLTAPLIYCDQFNYGTSMYETNDWYVFTGAGSIDTSFSPIGNKLNLTSVNNIKSPKHFIQDFKVDYALDSSNTVVKAPYSPIYSFEFDYTGLPTSEYKGYSVDDGSLHLLGFDEINRGVFDLMINAEAGDQMILYYKNSSGSFNRLCDNCNIVENETTNIKVVVGFSQRAVFPFNSSVSTDTIQIYANNTLIADNITFLNSEAVNIDAIQFEKKKPEITYLIDEYYVYTGIDKTAQTSQLYFKSLHQVNLEKNTTTLTSIDGDVMGDIGSMWYELGLRSSASRIMFGLAIIILVNLSIIGFMIVNGTNIHPAVFMSLSVIIMIFEVVVQLMPVWIPIVLGVLGAAAVAVWFRDSIGLQ